MPRTDIQLSKSQELKKTLDGLIDGYRDNPEEIAEMLAFKSRFYDYSMNNAMLIHAQNPYSTFVSSFKDWKSKGYSVKRGEHGIKIIFPIRTQLYVVGEKDGKKLYRRVADAPKGDKALIDSGKIQTVTKTSFGVGNVFDIAQTTRPPEDYPKFYSMGYSSDQHAALYESLKKYIQKTGVSVNEVDLQSIALRGQYIPADRAIHISDKLNDTEKLSTLSHEYGHALLHTDPASKNKNPSVKELEADCISIMLQQEFGIPLTDTRKRHFVGHYDRCKKLEGFQLEDVLKNTTEAYRNLRMDLDPYLAKEVQADKEKEQPLPDQKKRDEKNMNNTEYQEKSRAVISAFLERYYPDKKEYIENYLYHGGELDLDEELEEFEHDAVYDPNDLDEKAHEINFALQNRLDISALLKENYTEPQMFVINEALAHGDKIPDQLSFKNSGKNERDRSELVLDSNEQLWKAQAIEDLKKYPLRFQNDKELFQLLYDRRELQHQINFDTDLINNPPDSLDAKYRRKDLEKEKAKLAALNARLSKNYAPSQKMNEPPFKQEEKMLDKLKTQYPGLKENSGCFVLDETPGYAFGFDPKAPEALVLWSVDQNGEYRNGRYRHTLDEYDARDLVDAGLHVAQIQEILSAVGYAYEPGTELEEVPEQKAEPQKEEAIPKNGGQRLPKEVLMEKLESYPFPTTFNKSQQAALRRAVKRHFLTEQDGKQHLEEFFSYRSDEGFPVPQNIRENMVQTYNQIVRDFSIPVKNDLQASDFSQNQQKATNYNADRERSADTLKYIKYGVSILTVAKDMGFTPVKIGSYYSLKEHDSVRIYPETNSFYRFSTGAGGSNINLLMQLGGMNEIQAIRSLKDKYVGNRFDSIPRVEQPPVSPAPEPKPFVLPEKTDGKFSRTYAYLTATRCLDKEIVQQCMKDGLIYEDKKHNVIFVGKGAGGEPVYATRHTTLSNSNYKRDVAGSKQNVGFIIDNQSPRLYVTEAPIDALSLMCLHKRSGKDVKAASYMATCGTCKDAALYYRLKTNPKITEVILANDNDEAGKKANQRMLKHLQKEFPKIKVSCIKQSQKDINEYLCKFGGKCHKNPKKKSQAQEVER